MAKRKSRKITARVARREGGKIQVRHGDIKSVLAHFENICAEEAARKAYRVGSPFSEPTWYSRSLKGVLHRINKKANRLLEQLNKKAKRGKA